MPTSTLPSPAPSPATAPATGRHAGLAARRHAPTRPAAAPHSDSWRHVDAAQNGDNDAFGRLYDEYSHIVYRYVLFRVSDHCLAEDITSETFLRALRRIATVSYQGRDVAAWFITIAKNLVLDHVKSSRNRLEVPAADLTDTHRPQTQCGPEQQVLDAATQHELLHCVRQLNPDQRECIRLRFMQGLSVTETAQRMQRGEGAIKALQHRAVRRLAHLLPDDVR
ncbi:sigma-70 family RNA polymerase sigma factor [Saccharopolyspora sp. SCSIO 74807]|uniref:sigma-70 family RNA polymerase sigma factor n=1 Tax=Saccharopolyspora sp. SCSIO 74807 TaxID=3118084 RepID=UPI0030D0C6A2